MKRKPTSHGSVPRRGQVSLPANPAARAVLRHLQGLERAGGRILSGQFTNFGHLASWRQANEFHRLAGRWPAILGVDYADFSAHGGRRLTTQQFISAIALNRFDLVSHDNLHTAAPNRVALAQWRAGGLVTISAHCYNPANPRGGGLRDQGVDLADVLRRGTATHRRWLRQLDEIASALQELRDAGVVVLWRPFHEMNGAWFWWGGQPPRTFIRVWRHMFDYFSRERCLDNLLWVFSPNQGDDAGDYYPGDRYVDITGLDAYGDHVDRQHLRGYPQVARPGKPFGFTEFGPHGSGFPPGDFDYGRLLGCVRRDFPRTTFLIPWNAGWSPMRNRRGRKFLRDPRMVHREDLPRGLTSNLANP
jgi:mannan endo-1,4-beta-mannosidase